MAQYRTSCIFSCRHIQCGIYIFDEQNILYLLSLIVFVICIYNIFFLSLLLFHSEVNLFEEKGKILDFDRNTDSVIK